MRPYLDFSFLIRLLFQGRRGGKAAETLSLFEPPFFVNDLHLLQVENFTQQTVALDPRTAPVTARCTAFWHGYLDELVFDLEAVEWNEAHRQALTLNRQAENWPGTPTAVVHLAVAELTQATHFLSFDTHQRALAAKRGFTILPELIS